MTEPYEVYYRHGRRFTRRPAVRVPGHKLTVTWSGETGEERSSTGTCTCGWSESGSTQDVVRFEYRQHLRRNGHERVR